MNQRVEQRLKQIETDMETESPIGWKPLIHPSDAKFLLALVKKQREALEYTQRTDVIIGHSSDTDDGKLRGRPDKIMMRNVCAKALAFDPSQETEGT